MLFSGVRLEASEIVEEPQGLRVELSGGGGGDRHEPVVLGLKPPVVLGHLGAVGPVERVLVIGARPHTNVETGYLTTEPNQIERDNIKIGTQKSQRGKDRKEIESSVTSADRTTMLRRTKRGGERSQSSA